MPLAEMVALHEVSEAESTRIAVPAFAVVIARSAGGAVLVFNRFRKVWELPGGFIDPGESPVEAARRELSKKPNAEGKPSIGWAWSKSATARRISEPCTAAKSTMYPRRYRTRKLLALRTGDAALAFRRWVRPTPLYSTDSPELAQ